MTRIKHDVPEYTWVEIAESASSENRTLSPGDTCSLLKGGSVEVIGTDKQFGTLVRYSLPQGERAAGALCPDRALVFLSTDTLASWPRKGEVVEAMSAEKAALSAAVARIIAGYHRA